jgi:murein L,D-transpeptidase YafK
MVSKNTGVGKRGLDCGPVWARRCGMARGRFSVFVVGFLLAVGVAAGTCLIMERNAMTVVVIDRVEEVRRRVLPSLQAEVQARGLMVGAPVFLRSFKESFEIEVWLEPGPGRAFEHFRTYRTASWGPGSLGPKLKEGDLQSPEGFYAVGLGQLNPRSAYHLAFNVGYPNALDAALGRTGSFIMVHGGEASIGCLAVTDESIEEIYLLVEAALRAGQSAIELHLFPFRPTPARLSRATGHPSLGCWRNLGEGYDFFERGKRPPRVFVENGRYGFRDETSSAAAASPVVEGQITSDKPGWTVDGD